MDISIIAIALVVASSVFSLALFVLLVYLIHVQTMLRGVTSELHLVTTQIHQSMGAIASQILAGNNGINKLGATMVEFMNELGTVLESVSEEPSGEKWGRIYRTTDGKFIANSLEELMQKIDGAGLTEK